MEVNVYVGALVTKRMYVMYTNIFFHFCILRDQFGLPNIQDTKLLLGQPVTLPDEDVLPCLAESLLKGRAN